MMQSYRKLNVWGKAMELADEVYALTRSFPKDEMYGLTSQLRRAAVSIAANIAEGSQRNGKKEFLQFIAIAYASLAELETEMEIASRQKYIGQQQLKRFFEMTGEVGRMLNGLSASLDKPLQTANRQLQTAV